jgi:hypothetical protein
MQVCAALSNRKQHKLLSCLTEDFAMKASQKPELSKKWWSSEKPAEIKGAELEKALAEAEKAVVEAEKKGDPRSITSALTALAAVESAVEKTIKKECDKKKHKDVIAVLEKFYALLKAETSRLQALGQQAAAGPAAADSAEEDEEEEDESKLFDKDYLYKMLKLMRGSGKELRFGFGLNTNAPEASKLLLKRKGKPELLFKALKKTGEFSNRLLTYGYASADPSDGKTLVFRLEQGAGEPPQIIKLGRRYLRADKQLRFRKLKVVLPGGQTLEDTEPDTEDEEQQGQVAAARTVGAVDLSDEARTIEGLMAAWRQTLNDVSAQINRLRQAIDGQNEPMLRSVGERLGEVINDFPDLDLSKLLAAAKANDRAAYDRTLQQTAKEVRDVHNLLAAGPLLSTIDQNPFVKTNVHATVRSVLEQVSSALGV